MSGFERDCMKLDNQFNLSSMHENDTFFKKNTS